MAAAGGTRTVFAIAEAGQAWTPGNTLILKPLALCLLLEQSELGHWMPLEGESCLKDVTEKDMLETYGFHGLWWGWLLSGVVPGSHL